MVNTLLTIFWGIVLLSIVVVIHEGGHFLAARAFKVRVLEFMVGLPGPSIGYRKHGGQTRFGVTAIPLGGYARIAGMDEWQDESNLPRAAALLYKYGEITDEDAAEAGDRLGFDLIESLDILCEWGTAEKVKLGRGAVKYAAPETAEFERGEIRTIHNPVAFIAHEREQTYVALPCWKRIVISFAGPFANILTAVIVVTLVLSLSGTAQATLTLDDVPAGMPAYEAGMRAGDTITSVDGAQVATWEEFVEAISGLEEGQTVEIGYTRDGAASTAAMKTVISPQTGNVAIGVTAGVEQVKMSPARAFGESISYIGQVVVAICKLINPATAMDMISQSTSLVGISVVAKQAAELGFINFMWLTALISISIGLMNLLPIMPLDGGRIIVEAIQRIRRKVLNPAAVNAYTVAGIALVVLLFVVVTGQDIHNIATGGFPW
ncbi:MAG: M50 family metallopeptidase [Coriobacteriales bacterium]